VIARDWPGFGTTLRPPLRWTPDGLSAYLGDAPAKFGNPRTPSSLPSTAVLHHAAGQTGFTDRIAFLALTWARAAGRSADAPRLRHPDAAALARRD